MPASVGHWTGAALVASWCGKLPICPQLIVPLQIDLLMEVRRYLFSRSANQGALIVRRVIEGHGTALALKPRTGDHADDGGAGCGISSLGPGLR